MDLNDVLANVTDQDRGRELTIVNPWTGEQTDMKFWIVGPDSDTQRRSRIEMMDELADAADDDGKVSGEQREAARLNSLAKCVLRWDVKQGGEPLPFGQKNILRVFRAGAWIQAQVDAFAGDRANFRPEV
ncbi:hypothetical protein [Pararhizobium gei]|uniref:hypothetical protein n=1 Tax=Pararhizobium gei TaxID=1395951 RepID=UPI0023D98043|nr:hypothetical protein [Rhizobium gei]